MRLLKRTPDGDIQLVLVADESAPPYAILSHTWDHEQEVTHRELVAGTGKSKTGYAKIRFCVDRAAADGIEHAWVDTCCIDKSDAHEVQTAVNSMFGWYQRAKKCYVYLSDVEVAEEVSDAQAFRIAWAQAFRASRWFTRGWTLQELLAPAGVDFFSRDGRRLGSRISLERDICEVTGIPVGALRGQRLAEFSVEERMSWVARRSTTVREDKVYCLFGIFEVFLPLIYGEGEAYAESRLRGEIQRRQGGIEHGPVQDLAVSSLLPFQRNEHFSGRESGLQSLEQFVQSTGHRRTTIYGLGGCGKSALVLELAYRVLARDAGRLVLWVPAMSCESFELAYRQIGVRLGVRGITDDNADVKKLVSDALSLDSGRDWLMIVDNADDPDVLTGSGDRDDTRAGRLMDYLPMSGRGKIIFTTRSRKAAGSLTQSSVMELRDMDKAEARELLRLRITNHAMFADATAVDELLALLAYLPLAIVQAAAFISNNDISIRDYISLFHNTGVETELFGERFEDPSRYREMDSTIARTWHISFDQIRRQDPLAADYLSFMACIDRISIPQSLLVPCSSPVQLAKALGTLKGYAFITERQQASLEVQGGKTFDMHRLVHMALVWWLEGHGERASWTAKAAARLEEVVPYGGHEKKDTWMKYLSHATRVASPEGALEEVQKASILDRVGRCQSSLGQYLAAERTQRQVLLLREKRLGKKHERTLISMNEVGLALSDQGKYKAAEAMHRRKLEIEKEVFDPEHLDTLATRNNLALVLARQDKHKEAEAMYRQILSLLQEKVLDPAHPSTLTIKNNLAFVLDRQDKSAKAEAMHREILTLREKVLEPEHPDTLITKHNLAAALYRQDKFAEAEAMYRQTLALSERVLGSEHPDTWITKHNLALGLTRQGKYAEAEVMCRETLALREKAFEPEHSDTLASVQCLARLFEIQHRYDEARPLYQRACSGYSKVVGLNHRDTIACRQHYWRTFESQKQHRHSSACIIPPSSKRRKLTSGRKITSITCAGKDKPWRIDSQE